MARVLKRFHLERLSPGVHRLDTMQSRHLRDVLRMEVGEKVEVFDDAGHVATATIASLRPETAVHIVHLQTVHGDTTNLTIASAVPKGPRADWLVEKLSELGVAAFIPLRTARSVVLPESGKLTRWRRIAGESAKQCRRNGTMNIDELTDLAELLKNVPTDVQGWCLSTVEGSAAALDQWPRSGPIVAAIGPEGGWTDDELKTFSDHGFTSVSLTRTILRIETAAIAVASLVMSASIRRTNAKEGSAK